MRRPSVRHVSLIVRTEARRRIRALSGSPLRAVLLLLGGGLLVVFQLGLAVAVYFLADRIAAGSTLPLARVVAAGAWTLFVVVTAVSIVSNRSSYDAMDGLLTTVPAADVATAMVFTEAGGAVLPFAPSVVLAPAAFGLATGSFRAALAGFVGLACLFATATLTGFVAGFAVKNLAVRSAFVARFRGVLAALVFLAYLAVITTQTGGQVAGPVARAVAATPVAWFADLALLPVAPVSVLAGVGALALSVCVAVGALAVVFPLTEALWYADRARPAARSTGSAATTTVTPGAFARLDGGPAGWIAHKSVLRARRAPVKLLFLAYPLFALVSPIGQAVQSGVVPALLAAYVAVYAAWAAGAGFALNPLGDEGAALPVSATSGVRGRTFARGHLLATAVVGAPIALVVTAVVGSFSPLAPVAVAALVVASAGLCVGAGGVAAGVGSVLPRFEAVRVTRSRRATVPSLLAFVVYSVVLLVTASPAMAVAVPLVRDWLAGALGAGDTTLLVAGTAVSLLLVGIAGYLGYRLAANRFDDYTV